MSWQDTDRRYDVRKGRELVLASTTPDGLEKLMYDEYLIPADGYDWGKLDKLRVGKTFDLGAGFRAKRVK